MNNKSIEKRRKRTTGGNKIASKDARASKKIYKNSDGITELGDSEFSWEIFIFSIKGKKNENNTILPSGLYRDGILDLLNKQGYWKHFIDEKKYEIVFEKKNILEIVEKVNLKEFIFTRIKDQFQSNIVFFYKDQKVHVKAKKLHELFLNQSHLIFNDGFLEHLPTHKKQILNDTRFEAFFPFRNSIIKVNSEGIHFVDYNKLVDKCIWSKRIISRDYNGSNCAESQFARFIKNICNQEKSRIDSIRSAIGYLLHNFSNMSDSRAVIAYDEEITDSQTPMGGTGKGIIQQALAQLRTIVKIDGKKFNERDKFCFQDLDITTQIAVFDDIRADLGFERFHSILTEGWNIEKKNRPSFFLRHEVAPKVYITSNAIIQGEGTTNQRRQYIIEISPFYSKLLKRYQNPINVEHGCEFFSDWDENEWNSFFKYMFECTQFYFRKGLQECKHTGVMLNKLRQSTNTEFYEWIINQNIAPNSEYDMNQMFNSLKDTSYFGEEPPFKRRTFTKWLRTYAIMMDLELHTRRTNGEDKISFKCTSA